MAGNKKTMLGQEQKEWFLREVQRSILSHVLVVWVSEIPWLCRDEKWGWFRTERDELVRELVGMGAHRQMVILSGDAHMLGIDDGRHSPGGIPVLHAAALDSPPSLKGGPYSHGATPGRGQFARIEVWDAGIDVDRIREGLREVAKEEGRRWASVADAAAASAEGEISISFDDVPRFHWADMYASASGGQASTGGIDSRAGDGASSILPVPWHVTHGQQHRAMLTAGVCLEYHGF